MNIDQAYQEALDYLYSYIDFSLQRTFRLAPDQFDLDRMRALMKRLDNPQDKYPIIHVAGTKGKGSISAMCARILQSAGYKVGLFTSPHLIEYTERIQINQVAISKIELIELIEEIKSHVDAIPRLTTFEIGTALAFWYFGRKHVNAAVIEVGLGGRLDSTNIITPSVTVISSISYDHQEILGDSLAKIAAEKGGIIKKGVPLVVAPQQDEAFKVIELIAEEKQAPLFLVGRDLSYEPDAHSLSGQSFWLRKGNRDKYVETSINSKLLFELDQPIRLSTSLLGSHQIENAAVAFSAINIFRKVALPISNEAISEGFAAVDWPGRFDILREEPPIIVDSAHNRDSARKLAKALDDYFPGRRIVLVFGASSDKDIPGMFSELLPRVDYLITTASYHPRAADPDELVRVAEGFGKHATSIFLLEDALKEAIRIAGDSDLVLVTGSIFVAAGALQIWDLTHHTFVEIEDEKKIGLGS